MKWTISTDCSFMKARPPFVRPDLRGVACLVLLFALCGCSSPQADTPLTKEPELLSPATDDGPSTDTQVSAIESQGSIEPIAKKTPSIVVPQDTDTTAPVALEEQDTASQKSEAKVKPSRRRCSPSRNCCTRNKDCVTLDRATPCSCGPCGKVRRWTLNQRGYREYNQAWARKRCVKRRCEPCDGQYVGKAVCLEGKCMVR